MNNSVVYSPLARQDLEEVWDYIEVELKSPKAAQSTVLSIIERIRLLATFPHSGTPLSSICPVTSEYRFVSAKGYLIFYRVGQNKVFVDRVLHARRDYLRVLFGDALEADNQ